MPTGVKYSSILVSALLLSSIYVITISPPALAAEETVVTEAADEVRAASGSNRFVVWYDDTPSNSDIFFRRSTDSGANWQPTVNLSNNPGYSSDPQIAVSGARVYVVWYQVSTDGTKQDVYVKRSTDNGATWGPDVKASSSGTNLFASPQIAVSGSNVYITWDDDGISDIFLRRSTDNGATWKAIVRISNTAGLSAAPQIAVSGSNVYVTWSDNCARAPPFVCRDANFDILLRRSTDNGVTWKAVVNLSNNPVGSVSPQIETSGSNVYVTWQDYTYNRNAEIVLKRSTDNGATWKVLKDLSSSQGDSFSPQIETSGSNVYVTWYDEITTDGKYEVLFRRSTDNGATWKAVVNLSNNAGISEHPRIAVSGSNVFVVWQDNACPPIKCIVQHDIFMRRSTNNGATMQPLVQISSNAGFSFSSQVTAIGSDVYISWVDSTPGAYDILSRRSSDNGATLKTVKNLSSNAGFSFLGEIAG